MGPIHIIDGLFFKNGDKNGRETGLSTNGEHFSSLSIFSVNSVMVASLQRPYDGKITGTKSRTRETNR